MMIILNWWSDQDQDAKGKRLWRCAVPPTARKQAISAQAFSSGRPALCVSPKWGGGARVSSVLLRERGGERKEGGECKSQSSCYFFSGGFCCHRDGREGGEGGGGGEERQAASRS